MVRDKYDCFKTKFIDIGQNDCCTYSVFVLHPLELLICFLIN